MNGRFLPMGQYDEIWSGVPGGARVWSPVSALRERRIVVQAGVSLHTLVRAIPFQTASTLLFELPGEGQVEWELAADGSRSQGMLRRLSGQVETLLAVTVRFSKNLQRWVPVPKSFIALPVPSSDAPHPARNSYPADGGPVLIGYLVALSNARIANQIR